MVSTTASNRPEICVLKFGGTSVKNIARIRHVADIIETRIKNGPVVVVLSAMGDTTDYLLKLAHQTTSAPDKRELDLLLSTGEQISITLLSLILRSRGIKSRSVTAHQMGIFTESVHNNARIVDIKEERLTAFLAENDVIVAAGFQGVTTSGDITTLGRGGSDTTAVALAAALNATGCDIYTDVDGIFTADPNLIAQARLLEQITYEEVVEMARLGAQVIHPRAVELARQYKVPLRVRNTFKPDNTGTTVVSAADNKGGSMEIFRTVSGLAIDADQASVAIMDVPDQPGIAGKIMQAISEKNIVIDMIMQATHPTGGYNNITFTINLSDLTETIGVLETLKTDLKASDVISDPDIAKISLIGAGMIGQPGVAARLFSTLGAAGVNIKMIATSEMRLTCVVSRHEAEKAAEAIHQAFDLGQ